MKRYCIFLLPVFPWRQNKRGSSAPYVDGSWNRKQLRKKNARQIKEQEGNFRGLFYVRRVAQHSCNLQLFLALNNITPSSTIDCYSDCAKRELLPASITNAWTGAAERSQILAKLTLFCKQRVSIGSRKHYETVVLTRLYEQLNFDAATVSHDAPVWRDMFNEIANSRQVSWQNRTSLPIVNIYNEDSNATVTCFKILKLIKQLSLERHTLVVNVQDNAAVNEIAEYFEDLAKQLSYCTELISETFCFVIEVSPSFTFRNRCTERIQDLINKLTRFTELRKWIRFAIVTQSRIPDRGDGDLLCIRDAPSLEWRDLPMKSRMNLLDKKLYTHGANETSLRALGHTAMSVRRCLNSRMLAQLVVHDHEETPLAFQVPPPGAGAS